MTFLPDDFSTIGQVIAGAGLTYACIILAVRIVGLRSFAKFASHDFAVTVAIGSLLATGATSADTPLIIPLVAVATLFALQVIMSRALSRFSWFQDVAENNPVLLMEGRTILHENLKRSKMTEDELFGKLREANVTNLDQVLAVVFEGTGDVSVLHAPKGSTLEPVLLKDVERIA